MLPFDVVVSRRACDERRTHKPHHPRTANHKHTVLRMCIDYNVAAFARKPASRTVPNMMSSCSNFSIFPLQRSNQTTQQHKSHRRSASVISVRHAEDVGSSVSSTHTHTNRAHQCIKMCPPAMTTQTIHFPGKNESKFTSVMHWVVWSAFTRIL